MGGISNMGVFDRVISVEEFEKMIDPVELINILKAFGLIEER